MRTLLIFGVIGLSGCAGAQCKTVKDEPVSVCRAQQECKGGAGHRIASAFGMILGGAGAGAGHSNPVMDQYNSCIDQNLAAQRANAGIPDNETNCRSRVQDGILYTRCN